jgi:hypothetical protein
VVESVETAGVWPLVTVKGQPRNLAKTVTVE